MHVGHTAGVHVQRTVNALLATQSHKATSYRGPNDVIKATRRLFGWRIDGRARRIEVLVTIGRPNYVERRFIAKCKAAGEPFPVKKVQLKAIPQRRAN